MADGLTLEFTDPSGDPLRFDWQADALSALDPTGPGSEPVWRLGGELDWDEVETVRVLSGRLDDQRSLAIVALRLRGAAGHGDEVVAGALSDGVGFDQLAEILFSTEYAADGAPARVGLELYRDEAAIALRVAGDVVATAAAEQAGVRRVSAALELRSGGDAGAGVLDLLTRA